MKSRWQSFKDFIRTKEIGYVFTRKQLIQELHYNAEIDEEWSGIPKSTIAMCVKHMFAGKFMKYVGRGKYELIATPPEELAIQDCSIIAKGDNLTYIERLHNRKERIKRRSK